MQDGFATIAGGGGVAANGVGDGVGVAEAVAMASKMDSFVSAVCGTIKGEPSPREITTPPLLGRIEITETCDPAFRVMEPTVFPSTTSGTGMSAIKVPGVGGEACRNTPINKKTRLRREMIEKTTLLKLKNLIWKSNSFLLSIARLN